VCEMLWYLVVHGWLLPSNSHTFAHNLQLPFSPLFFFHLLMQQPCFLDDFHHPYHFLHNFENF
jgi:hypothetical protein